MNRLKTVWPSVKKLPTAFDTLFARIFCSFLLITVATHSIAAGLLLLAFGSSPFANHVPDRGLAVGLSLQVAAIAICAWWGASRSAKPLKWLAQMTSAMASDVNAASIEVQGPVEARNAARILNQLQCEIRRQLAERAQFLAAVSHDLRTPLTRINLRIQTLGNVELRARLERDIVEMSWLLDSTLSYLRDGDSQERFEMIDIEALVHSVIEDEQEAGHIATSLGGAAPILGQPVALKRCLANIITNAIRYGGVARVQLIDDSDTLSIEVHDQGPGIAAEDIEQVFQPFNRVESSRNQGSGGFGLGLTIARDVARRHDGNLTLRNLNAGGLCATLTMRRDRLNCEPGRRPV